MKLIDAAFKLVLATWKEFAAINAPVFATYVLINVLSLLGAKFFPFNVAPMTGMKPEDALEMLSQWWWVGALAFTVIVVMALAQTVCTAATIEATNAALTNQKLSPQEALSRGLSGLTRTALPLLAVTFLSMGAALFFVIPGVFVMLGLCLTFQAAQLDHAGTGDALSASWQKMRGRRWSVLLLFFVTGVAPQFVAGILNIAIDLVTPDAVEGYLEAVVSAVASIAGSVWGGVALTMLYKEAPGPNGQTAPG